VAYLETYWRSPHLSTSIDETAMVSGNYNRAENHISSGLVIPKIRSFAVDLKALLDLFASNRKCRFSSVEIRCCRDFGLLLLWLFRLFVAVFTFGLEMSFRYAAIRCRSGSDLTAVVHQLPQGAAGGVNLLGLSWRGCLFSGLVYRLLLPARNGRDRRSEHRTCSSIVFCSINLGPV